MNVDTICTAIAHASGAGRDGRVRSEDDRIDLELRRPPEMGGEGGGADPEHLFAAAYAASFLGALHDAGRHLGVDVADAQVSAQVGIGPTGAGGFRLSVELDVHLPSAAPARRAELVELADANCPYSIATRGNVVVSVEIVG